MKKKGNALVLFSGGIDSTACIQYYLDLDYTINPLFINYGQLPKIDELKSAQNICKYYGLNLTEFKVQTKNTYTTGEIVGRNLMLLANALFNIGNNETIVMGIHSGTGYYDCSQSFIDLLNKIIFESTNGTVRLESPFIDWDKKQIFDYCSIKKVPIELTYSCEKGGTPKCGKCATCRDLNMLYGE